jgi:hypothetical protein
MTSLWLTLGLLGGVLSDPLRQAPDTCRASADVSFFEVPVTALIGTYDLNFVQVHPSVRNAPLAFLELHPALAEDSSPRTHRRADSSLIRFEPLIGRAALTLRGFRVLQRGIPLTEGELDPVYPPVLVTVRPPGRSPGPITISINPEENRRDGVNNLDGGHILLSVQHLSPDGFSGQWNGGGNMDVGSGYYCAHRRPSPRE